MSWKSDLQKRSISTNAKRGERKPTKDANVPLRYIRGRGTFDLGLAFADRLRLPFLQPLFPEPSFGDREEVGTVEAVLFAMLTERRLLRVCQVKERSVRSKFYRVREDITANFATAAGIACALLIPEKKIEMEFDRNRFGLAVLVRFFRSTLADCVLPWPRPPSASSSEPKSTPLARCEADLRLRLLPAESSAGPADTD